VVALNSLKNGCRDATIVTQAQQLATIWLYAAVHPTTRRFFATPLHENFAERGSSCRVAPEGARKIPVGI
jgi:hypothetical protein